MCLCYHRLGAWNITWKLESKQSLHWDLKPWSISGHTTLNMPGLIWNHGVYTIVLVERHTSLFSLGHPVFQPFATDQTTQKPRERARRMQGISLKANSWQYRFIKEFHYLLNCPKHQITSAWNSLWLPNQRVCAMLLLTVWDLVCRLNCLAYHRAAPTQKVFLHDWSDNYLICLSYFNHYLNRSSDTTHIWPRLI